MAFMKYYSFAIRTSKLRALGALRKIKTKEAQINKQLLNLLLH